LERSISIVRGKEVVGIALMHVKIMKHDGAWNEIVSNLLLILGIYRELKNIKF
jgi:hypothetical protein